MSGGCGYGYAVQTQTPPDGKCWNCGSSDDGLRRCNSCKDARYCSRECQVDHWKEHKAFCRHRSASSAARDPRNEGNRDVLMESIEAQYEMLRKARKEGTQIVCVSNTHAGLVGPGMPIPEGVPSNFGLKQQALTEFQSRRGHRQFFGEASYKAYYDELVQNESEWEEFFRHPRNHEHVEHTCGIMGTYATLLRQRGSYEECGRVLDVERKALDVYGEHCAVPRVPAAQVSCFEGLVYLYNRIRYNLNNNLERYHENIEVFRDLCVHEAKRRLSFEEQDYLYTLEGVMGIDYRRITVDDIRALSDEQCLRAIMIPIDHFSDHSGFQKDQAKRKKRVQLLACGHCRKLETALGQFKECTRCEKAVYCSRDCQRNAWKMHKKVCGKKK
eukprot:CAMPEP_0172561026 /NCGR_PEP_ID=MMETSP1067-20121228/91244_1 /TAXON_ID=265564 ORGANISM="Thalassiosira punctigera, Strain Tpunct2005C2" /NCGR_SAMPLE_ID=MMETSP1067 /ASSEMBLY_ACC=CAM_ASM_000444 /LENGTH=385 /DNA_ID=CAMNT_0013350975 /DNA_START=162 /DNA_END=1319 /DNA_ORIENTATION=+